MLIEKDSNALPFFFTDVVYIAQEKQQVAANKKEEDPQEAIVSDPSPTSTASVAAIPYAGKNLKKILILFQNKEGKDLPENQQVFLGKVLQAVNLNFDDIAMVNVNPLQHSDYALLSHFDALVWLSFGITHENLPIHPDFPFYEIIKTDDCSFLLADSLEAIENNRDKKVSLWNSLKALFR